VNALVGMPIECSLNIYTVKSHRIFLHVSVRNAPLSGNRNKLTQMTWCKRASWLKC